MTRRRVRGARRVELGARVEEVAAGRMCAARNRNRRLAVEERCRYRRAVVYGKEGGGFEGLKGLGLAESRQSRSGGSNGEFGRGSTK